MPVRLRKIASGATVFLHTCEDCGEDAAHGVNVRYKDAMIALDDGDKDRCKHLLGKWYCGKHVPVKAAPG